MGIQVESDTTGQKSEEIVMPYISRIHRVYEGTFEKESADIGVDLSELESEGYRLISTEMATTRDGVLAVLSILHKESD